MLKPVARLQPEMKECLITILSNAVSNKTVILIIKLSFISEVCLFNAYAKSRRQMPHDVNVVVGKGSCYFACEYAGRAGFLFILCSEATSLCV